MANAGPVLESGDRFPNVLIRDQDGTRSLYNFHQGGRVAIAWGAGLGAAVGEALQSMPMVCIGLDAAAGGPRHIEASAELTPLVAAGQSRGVLLLDPALRVLARIDGANNDDIVSQLRSLLADEPATKAQGSPGIAPVLVLPRVLEPVLCADVIAHFHAAGGGDPSGVVVFERGQPKFQLDPTVKMRREMVVKDPGLDARLHARLGRRVLPEIERAFQFKVARRDPFKIIRYDAGAGYFRAHRDNDTPDVAHRRFAMTLNLNTGEYRGGCLRFPEFGDALYEAEAGGALIFSCSLLHEVTDITDGTRLAMTSFFF